MIHAGQILQWPLPVKIEAMIQAVCGRVVHTEPDPCVIRAAIGMQAPQQFWHTHRCSWKYVRRSSKLLSIQLADDPGDRNAREEEYVPVRGEAGHVRYVRRHEDVYAPISGRIVAMPYTGNPENLYRIRIGTKLRGAEKDGLLL